MDNNKFYSDEFILSLPEDPVFALVDICNYYYEHDHSSSRSHYDAVGFLELYLQTHHITSFEKLKLDFDETD